jgi:hypothetical protein
MASPQDEVQRVYYATGFDASFRHSRARERWPVQPAIKSRGRGMTPVVDGVECKDSGPGGVAIAESSEVGRDAPARVLRRRQPLSSGVCSGRSMGSHPLI